jgi:hypothetical protein
MAEVLRVYRQVKIFRETSKKKPSKVGCDHLL